MVVFPLHPSSPGDLGRTLDGGAFRVLETQRSPDKLETPYINDEEALPQGQRAPELKTAEIPVAIDNDAG